MISQQKIYYPSFNRYLKTTAANKICSWEWLDDTHVKLHLRSDLLFITDEQPPTPEKVSFYDFATELNQAGFKFDLIEFNQGNLVIKLTGLMGKLGVL